VRASVPNRGRSFWGWEFDARAARPVAGSRAIAVRFQAAGTSPETPYFLRPVVGGTGSLRGFATAGLSGALGARALWQASVEWRQPLAGPDPLRPKVTGTVFFDVGDHWTDHGERAGVAASIGYGALFRVRWLQTINIEVAYPLTADPTGSPVSVRAGLGRSF
jgi:outer membrane protein assembly factor BamA